MFPISLENLNNQERHDYILQTFILNKSNQENRKHKRDLDIIRSNHRFLWDESEQTPDTWELRLAKRYYSKLFREYCIADLTRYKENRVALRWRTETEVVTGKGQFQCGSRKCENHDNLRSWEVNFAYIELDQRKNALVKVRLCPEHSAQLNYTSQKREIKRLKRVGRQAVKSKRKEEKAAKSGKTPVAEIALLEKSDEAVGEMRSQLEDTASSESGHSDTEVGEKKSEEIYEKDENVWSKKPEAELEQQTREVDFERYLEDLLL